METLELCMRASMDYFDIASIIGSGINGNFWDRKWRLLENVDLIASIIGSGINGNVFLFSCLVTGLEKIASIIGSGINGNKG